MVRIFVAVLTLVFTSAPAFPQKSPGWFNEHLAFMTQGSGRWIADNSGYRSEKEPYDSYGTEWKWGLGKRSMTGRLFGLVDGEEVGDFWEFRVFWHTGESRAYIHQYSGNGTVGVGTIDSAGSNQIRSYQTFFHEDGTKTRIGHDTWEAQGPEHHTQSYDISEGGVWEKRRSYVWVLQR